MDPAVFDKSGDLLAYLRVNGQDMQNNAGVFLASQLTPNDFDNLFYFRITAVNVLPMCVYYAVRRSTEHTTWNHNDQFLYPRNSWKEDGEFLLNCVAYTLFHEKNRISSRAGNVVSDRISRFSGLAGSEAPGHPVHPANPGILSKTATVNHWIPFTEDEVGCTSAFASHFMSDWLRGKAPHELAQSPQSPPSPFPETSRTSREIFSPAQPLLFGPELQPFAAEADATYDLAQSPPNVQSPILETSRTLQTSREAFSPAARAVFDAGRELWRYYHAQPNAMPDASLYDIRAYFQGFKPNGHMNSDSADAEYTSLIAALRSALKALAAQIATKVYEHGFLRN